VTFCKWAEAELKIKPIVESSTLVEMFSEALKRIDEQGKERRTFLTDELAKTKFASWSEIIKAKGK